MKRLNQTRQKLNFARDIQTTANNPEAGRLIRMADVNLRRAADAARNLRRFIAARKLRKADNAVNSALKILFRENITNRRRKLENLIGEAGQLTQTHESPEARQLFEQGLKNRDLAVNSLKNNDFKQALFYYNKAVFLLRKSITVARNEDKSTAQLAEDEAYRFDQFYQKNKQVLPKSSNPAVRKNTNLALKIANKADQARRNGEFQQAIDYYHQATRLMSRALNIATGKGGLTETRADEEVALLDELVENLESQLTPENSDEMTNFLFSQIKLLQENAHVFLKDQKSDEAIKNASMARNLAERLLKKMRKPSGGKKPSIAIALTDLEDHIRQIEPQVTQDTDTEVKILLNYAKTGWRKAQTAANNNNFLLALEVIDMAENLLNSADQMINDNAPQISQQKLKERIDKLNKLVAENRLKVERAKNNRTEFHFNQAENMLQLAQENYDKGFFHVANAFLQLGANHIRKIGRIN
ncbi:MAG: hypothetical protein GXO74_00155 [Calditrichaeota bacterium]|nr:hypothetical protein [Calditrichota bacterium]